MMERADRRLWRRTSIATAIAAIALFAGGPAPAAAAHTEMSFEFYHSSLAPYGSWHVSASFGQVWVPHVHVIGWHPYAYGHWVYSDLGWVWVSEYEWGAIPYHYGTWALDPEIGWVWVPGYVWAPSWVVFRSGPSYVGWAPVPPTFSVGVSFSFDDYGPDHFVFVRETDFLAADVHRYAVPIERTRVVYRDTQVVNRIRIENDVIVNRGLDVQRVERVARAPLRREPIESVPRIAPGERVTRDDLRVDPQRVERGRVRAAAPAPAQGAPERETAPRDSGQERGKERGRERGSSMQPPHEREPQQPERDRVFEQPSPQREPAVRQSREREPAVEQPQAPPKPRREPREMQREREPVFEQPREQRPHEQPEPAVRQSREREPAAEPRPHEPGPPPQREHEPVPPQQRGDEPGPPPRDAGPAPERPREAPSVGSNPEQRHGPPPQRGRRGQPEQEQQQGQPEQPDDHGGGRGHGQRG
ncbi:MAG: hypothetical protein E6J87_22165 [Deltaproteobacteria bacterium]|nr:MAG: hypothetical protein E6J87_22165 [Deltaproteobacteria bacterium]